MYCEYHRDHGHGHTTIECKTIVWNMYHLNDEEQLDKYFQHLDGSENHRVFLKRLPCLTYKYFIQLNYSHLFPIQGNIFKCRLRFRNYVHTIEIDGAPSTKR